MRLLMNPRAFLAKYRTQLLLGLGGLAAFFTYRGRVEQQAAAAAAPATVVPGDTSAAYQSGMAQGAGLYGAGVAQGIAPTEQALGLAGHTVGGAVNLAQGAQALASAAVGDYFGLGSQLVGAVTGLLTPVPAPIQQPAPAPSPVPGPVAPAPSPAPTPSSVTTYRNVSLGYRVYSPRGGSGVWAFVGRCGGFTGVRVISFGGPWYQPAGRAQCDTRGVVWNIRGGANSGLNLLSWRPEGASVWAVQRGNRREALVNGIRTVYHDSWTAISKTGS